MEGGAEDDERSESEEAGRSEIVTEPLNGGDAGWRYSTHRVVAAVLIVISSESGGKSTTRCPSLTQWCVTRVERGECGGSCENNYFGKIITKVLCAPRLVV